MGAARPMEAIVIKLPRMKSVILLVALLVGAALLLNTPAAMAAPEGDAAGAHHDKSGAIPTIEQGLSSGVAALFVFFAVFGVLSVKVWPKVVKGLSERESKIREEIEAAEAARKQARDALEQYEQSLAEARAEAQKMLDETKSQQQQLAADLRAKADAELSAMRERAMRDLDAAKRAALAEIYDQAATVATAAAGKILKRELNADDQRGLVEETLAQLQGKAS